MSFGIITSKLNATNLRGTRVQAKMHTAQGQTRSVSKPYNHAKSLSQNYMDVAQELAAKYDSRLVAECEYDYISACGMVVWEAVAKTK